MINYTKDGTYEIMEGNGQNGNLIFKAATTCYQNEATTKKTPEEFITMLKSNNHTAMLEFMWVVMRFDISKYADIFSDEDDFVYFIETFLLLNATDFLKAKPIGNGKVVVYGNARAWLQHMDNILCSFDAGALSSLNLIMVDAIVALKGTNATLFDFQISGEVGESRAYVLPHDHADIGDDPELNWVMVKFDGVSRGLTHELVRHRSMSFAQVSTRYVDHSAMDIIFPFDEIPEECRDRVKDAFASMQAAYTSLLEKNVPKGIARQLLPTGIAATICVAGTFAQWHALFELRVAPEAHWEIRNIMGQLSEELIKNNPSIFDRLMTFKTSS